MSECCYWYRRFPTTPSVCHGTNQTRTVGLICEIQYWSPNNSNKKEVMWHRSRSEEYAGVKGEILIDKNKYTRNYMNLISVNQSFIIQYYLGIENSRIRAHDSRHTQLQTGVTTLLMIFMLLLLLGQTGWKYI